MTTSELIEKLSHYPKDLKIVWTDMAEVVFVTESEQYKYVILSDEKPDEKEQKGE